MLVISDEALVTLNLQFKVVSKDGTKYRYSNISSSFLVQYAKY